jgi:hypothetical protein
MTRSGQRFEDEDLGRALRELGERLDYPEAGPEVALAVGHRLRAGGAPADRGARVLRPVLRPVWHPTRQRAAAALVAMVIALTGVLVVSPTARRAVATWLGLRGAQLEVVPTLPSAPTRPLGEGLFLGRPVTLAEARMEVPYRIVVPTLPELGPPDAVYLDARAGDGIVSLVYRARPGYPSAAQTGAAVLVTQFRAEVDTELIEKKVTATDTRVVSVAVDGGEGFWLEGRPHVVYFLDPKLGRIEETVRLAGNVLLWGRGEVTLRIEANISLEEALRIAGSVR